MKVELKQWNSGMTAEIMDLCNRVDRSYISNRLPYPYTEKDAAWWLNMVQEKEGKAGVFRAVYADGICVGNISVERQDDVRERDAEIGYMLMDDVKTRGIMTEAVRQICPVAFQELDIVRISGLVYHPNQASRRVLEKNGFALEGTLRNAISKNGNLYDLCIYGKLAEES